MGLYSKIKKEHVFVFVILLCALVVFDYFGASYSGLVVRQEENCLAFGGVCCDSGLGEHYFSLDDTCGDKECWSECVSYSEERIDYTSNYITGFGFVDWVTGVWDKILNRGVVGEGVSNYGCVGNIYGSEICDIYDSSIMASDYKEKKDSCEALKQCDRVYTNNGLYMKCEPLRDDLNVYGDCEQFVSRVECGLFEGCSWNPCSTHAECGDGMICALERCFEAKYDWQKYGCIGNMENHYLGECDDFTTMVIGGSDLDKSRCKLLDNCYVDSGPIRYECVERDENYFNKNCSQFMNEGNCDVFDDYGCVWRGCVDDRQCGEGYSCVGGVCDVESDEEPESDDVGVYDGVTEGCLGDINVNCGSFVSSTICNKVDGCYSVGGSCTPISMMDRECSQFSLEDDCNMFGDYGCSWASCGDGNVDVELGEECDGGNVIAGDGCDSYCKSEGVCGDGNVDEILGEECDDGNVKNDDGCSSDCLVEDVSVLPEIGSIIFVEPKDGDEIGSSFSEKLIDIKVEVEDVDGVKLDDSYDTLMRPKVQNIVGGESWFWMNYYEDDLWKTYSLNLKCDSTCTFGQGSCSSDWECGVGNWDNEKGCKNRINIQVDSDGETIKREYVDIYCKKGGGGGSVECDEVAGESEWNGVCYPKCDLKRVGYDYVVDVNDGNEYRSNDCLGSNLEGIGSGVEGVESKEGLCEGSISYDGGDMECRFMSQNQLACIKADGCTWHSTCGYPVSGSCCKGTISTDFDCDDLTTYNSCAGFRNYGCNWRVDLPSMSYVEVSEGNDYCEARFGSDRGICYGVKCAEGYVLADDDVHSMSEYEIDLSVFGNAATDFAKNIYDDNWDLVCVEEGIDEAPDAPTGLQGWQVSSGGECNKRIKEVRLEWNYDEDTFGRTSGRTSGRTGSVVGINYITGNAIVKDYNVVKVGEKGFFETIGDFFRGLFGKKIVGFDFAQDGYVVYRKIVGGTFVDLQEVDFGDCNSGKCIVEDSTIEYGAGTRNYVYGVSAVKSGRGSEILEVGVEVIAPDNEGPVINIEFPDDNAVVEGASVEFVVEVTDDSGVLNVEAWNNKLGGPYPLTDVVGDGIYEGLVNLEGDDTGVNEFVDNEITIKAIDNKCNDAELTRIVQKKRPEGEAPFVEIVVPSDLGADDVWEISDSNYVEIEAEIGSDYDLNKVYVINTALDSDSIDEIPMERISEYDDFDVYGSVNQHEGNIIPHVKLSCGGSGVLNLIEVRAIDNAGKTGLGNVEIVCSYREDDLVRPIVNLNVESEVNMQYLERIGIEIIDESFENGDSYSGRVWVEDENGVTVSDDNYVFNIGENVIENVKLFDGTTYEGDVVVKVEVVDDNAGEDVDASLTKTLVSQIVKVDVFPPDTYITVTAIEGGVALGNDVYEQGVNVVLVGDVDGDEVHDGSYVSIYYKLDDENEYFVHSELEPLMFDINSLGEHVIRYYSIDASGNEEDVQERTINIVNANVAPIADIVSHESGDNEYKDRSLSIRGRVVDEDNGVNDELSYVWEIDGVEKSSGSCVGKSCSARLDIDAENLEVGTYEISLIATDIRNAVGRNSIELNIIERIKPSVSFTRPIENSIFEVNKEITFVAIGDDRDDPDGVIVSYQWYVDDVPEGVLGDCKDSDGVDMAYCGKSLFYTFEELGDHEVSFEIVDNNGNVVREDLGIVINQINSPEPTIKSPLDNANYVIGGLNHIMLFEAEGDDEGVGGVAGEIVSWTWTLVKNAGLEGETRIPIGIGRTFTRNVGVDIAEGYYNVELTVVDNDGNFGKAVSENIHVKSKHAPTVVIESPDDEEVFYTTDTISFIGVASDPDGDNIGLWEWRSNKDGLLNDEEKWGDACILMDSLDGNYNYGFTLKAEALSLGRHKIKVLVVDDSDKLYEDTYVIHISIDPNYAPHVDILEPVGSGGTANVYEGDDIIFKGKAYDVGAEGITGICRYEWVSDKMSSPFGFGSDIECDIGDDVNILPTISSSELPVGINNVELWVWDEEGLSSHKNIKVNVLDVPLRFMKPSVSELSLEIDDSQEFIAVGGSGAYSYTWSVDGDCGELDVYIGSNVVFTALEEGSCDVVVSSGSQSISIEINVNEPGNEILFPFSGFGLGDVSRYSHESYGYIMKIIWDESFEVDVDHYVIEYKKGSGVWTALPGGYDEIGLSVGETYHYGSEVCDAGSQCLEDGLRYYYRVKVQNVNNEDLTEWSQVIEGIMSYNSFTEDCSNALLDNDGDGIVAGIDADCSTLNKIKLLNTTKINKDDEVYVGSKLNVDCYFDVVNSGGNVLNEDVYYNSGVQCISAKVGDNECNVRQEVSEGRVRFRSCNVGDEEGEDVAVECYVNSKCNVAGLGSAPLFIDIIDFEYCEDGVMEGDLQIYDFDLDENSYTQGEDIEVEVRVENMDIDEEDLDVVVKVQLYDIDMDKKVVESSEQLEIEYGKKEKFELTLLVPSDVDEDDDYIVLVKAYERGNEDEACVQDKIYVGIEENDCEDDEDDDGFISEECGGDDCDDFDEYVNPLMTERCTDLIDNDCDGDIDGEDEDCKQCVSGQTRECGSNIGACVKGTQTCVNEVWGVCLGGVSSSVEKCDDLIDNDCDGYTDCDDSSCRSSCGSPNDEDEDGLPDDWELEYFGDLRYGWNDDPDGDGYLNYEELDMGTDPYVAEPSSSKWWIWLVLVFVVAVVVVLLLVLLNKGKKSQSVVSSSGKRISGVKPSSGGSGGNAVLRNYVKGALAKGFRRAQIEKVLIAKGWSKKDILNAFK